MLRSTTEKPDLKNAFLTFSHGLRLRSRNWILVTECRHQHDSLGKCDQKYSVCDRVSRMSRTQITLIDL